MENEIMKPIIVRHGWVKEWERDSAFTIVIETENEEDRKALLETMRDNKGLKITIEEESE
jgi:hypothetical protein